MDISKATQAAMILNEIKRIQREIDLIQEFSDAGDIAEHRATVIISYLTNQKEIEEEKLRRL